MMHPLARKTESKRLIAVTRIFYSMVCHAGVLGMFCGLLGGMLARSLQAGPSQTPSEWITADCRSEAENRATNSEELSRCDVTAISDSTMFYELGEDALKLGDGVLELGDDVQEREEARPNRVGLEQSASAASCSLLPAPLGTLPQSLSTDLRCDRFWLIDTRSISHQTCCMNLHTPNFRIQRLDTCGRRRPSSLDEYLASMDSDRPRFIYIHGNRRDSATAISQGLNVYQQLAKNRPSDQPFDWVIWSWPSEANSFLISDVREKARRTDSQGLYVAWLLREHHVRSQPTGMIGFSFGGRIASGALHALAGGAINRRTIGEPAIRGANIDVGLLAPAVDSTWMMPGAHHGLATQNMNRLVLLYNRRDFALKYFRLISRDPRSEALGYTGPRYFAPRYDGTPLPVRARDCAHTVGNHHREQLYYKHACYAGREMASLIDSTLVID